MTSNSPRLALPTLLAIAAFAFTGCNPASRLIGQWEIDKTAIQADIEAEAKGNPLAAMAGAFVSMFQFDLEFKGDGTCSFTGGAMGQTQTKTGKWRYVKSDGEVLVLSVTDDDTKKEHEVRVTFTDDDHVRMVPPADAAEAAGGRTMPFQRIKPK